MVIVYLKENTRVTEITNRQWEKKYHYRPTENDGKPQCSICTFCNPLTDQGWKHNQYSCNKKWEDNPGGDFTVAGYYVCDLWIHYLSTKGTYAKNK
jgi:hypothetical protein